MKLETMIDMGYRAIHRLRLQFMGGGEGGATYPWDFQDPADGLEGGGEHDELAPGFSTPAGVIWYYDPDRIIRYTASTYEPAGEDPPVLPIIYDVARHYIASLGSGSQTVTIVHDDTFKFSKLFPTITIWQRNVINEWFVYDPLQNGGSIQQDVTTGDIIIDMGANIDYGAVATLVG